MEYSQAHPASETADARDNAAREIIGGDYPDYYLDRFEKFTADGGKFSVQWNWSGFAFEVLWLFYRKMYGLAFAVLLAKLLLYLGLVFLAVHGIFGDNFTLREGVTLLALFPITYFLPSLAIGATGNYFYYKKVSKEINRYDGDEWIAHTEELKKKLIANPYAAFAASTLLVLLVDGGAIFGPFAIASLEAIIYPDFLREYSFYLIMAPAALVLPIVVYIDAVKHGIGKTSEKLPATSSFFNMSATHWAIVSAIASIFGVFYYVARRDINIHRAKSAPVRETMQPLRYVFVFLAICLGAFMNLRHIVSGLPMFNTAHQLSECGSAGALSPLAAQLGGSGDASPRMAEAKQISADPRDASRMCRAVAEWPDGRRAPVDYYVQLRREGGVRVSFAGWADGGSR